ncbi:MAG: GNAT family N-acetyltransferase [Propionibacteriaceae bacterium]|jgi:ribosomal-protein-alanine N-acetyltransferase|nr:GNAT family N-acetyltransferase [Propionibacteriaceae bacterium]
MPEPSVGLGPSSPPVLPRQHRWPVGLRFGDLWLTAFGRRDLSEWKTVRHRNASWLDPWEATPPDRRQRRRSGRAMVAFFQSEARHGRMVPWLIRPDQAGRPGPLIGQCTLSNIVYGSARFASIGYWIDQDWAGRGLVPAAVALTTDYAMTVMGLHRVEVCVRPENAASLRVVEKLGFRYEGVRPRYIHIAGAWRDHKCFALDASDVPDGLCARLIGGQS